MEWHKKENDKGICINHKLPIDDIHLENATILQRFSRYPLIIEPVGQDIEFIKTFYTKII